MGSIRSWIFGPCHRCICKPKINASQISLGNRTSVVLLGSTQERLQFGCRYM